MPICLYGDDVRLRQVLINILNNAVKFTQEGFVRLAIRAGSESIDIDISDSGIGIKEEDIPNVFAAFAQADMLKNRSQEGTGLGLSITKSLIEMMDGRITVESVYGQGTVFHITIPKVLGDETLIKYEGSSESAVYAPDAKILVVDDNLINLNVACGLLGLCEITADTAASGKEAIELIRKNRYDLIFMDHMMPEMDGVEATKIIREMGINMPIIALTANAITGAREEFIAAGMNDLLTKPIKKALLFKILENWLPKEKIAKAPSAATQAASGDETAEFWKKIEQIEAISVQTGLERISGQKEIYKNSLKLMISEIDKCEKTLNDFLAAGDTRNFSIGAHSLKGCLANIGAMELSSRAYELEAAADRADSSFCTSHLPPFMEDLHSLSLSLTAAFEEKTKSANSESVEVPLALLVVLKKLAAAIAKTDFAAIDKAIETLDALKENGELKEGTPLNEETEKIKDAILMMDYESAVKVIKTFI